VIKEQRIRNAVRIAHVGSEAIRGGKPVTPGIITKT